MRVEESFGRWSAIGVPLFLVIGTLLSVAIHFAEGITWSALLPPMCGLLGLQVGFYLAAFYAGRLVRNRGILWPMAILAGVYLWGTKLMILDYGPKWEIIQPFDSLANFSTVMALITLFLVIVSSLVGPRIKKIFHQ